MQVDWSKVLMRCSCIGKIMTEGKGTILTEKQGLELERLQSLPSLTEKQTLTLADLVKKRDAPPSLSDTCTSYLREVYQFHKYGKESIGGAQRSIYVKKGNAMEHESLMLMSRFYGVTLEKNTIRKNGTHLTGETDALIPEIRTSWDAKSAWDMESLLSHVPNPDKPNQQLYEPAYEFQGQGYMKLYDLDTHHLCYVLVNMPPEMVQWEIEKIRRAINPVTEENIEFKEAVEKLENNMCFDEIPIDQRIVSFTFSRDDEMMRKIESRVEDCRVWLEKFEKIHINLHNK